MDLDYCDQDCGRGGLKLVKVPIQANSHVSSYNFTHDQISSGWSLGLHVVEAKQSLFLGHAKRQCAHLYMYAVYNVYILGLSDIKKCQKTLCSGSIPM